MSSSLCTGAFSIQKREKRQRETASAWELVGIFEIGSAPFSSFFRHKQGSIVFQCGEDIDPEEAVGGRLDLWI